MWERKASKNASSWLRGRKGKLQVKGLQQMTQRLPQPGLVLGSAGDNIPLRQVGGTGGRKASKHRDASSSWLLGGRRKGPGQRTAINNQNPAS